jgi:hypothetical protein
MLAAALRQNIRNEKILYRQDFSLLPAMQLA